MRLIEKNGNQITFSAEIEESVANALRRYVNKIQTLAIDEVEISRNDSPLYDETIAHRLGLIPLKMDKAINEKSSIGFKLGIKKEGMVQSKELRSKVKIVYDKIPLTSLSKNQELEISATAKVGKGEEHSKFSPGLIFYRNVSEIIMDKRFYDEIKKICPKNEVKEKGDKIIILDNLRKSISDVCEGICEKERGKVEIIYGDDLIISLESFGQLETEDIFKKSIEELKKDLKEFSKKIDKI